MPLCDFTDISLAYGLSQFRDAVGEWFCHPAVQLLRRYDLENQTELCHTLRVYLECERSYVKTAKQLYIHRNSLLYRIQRIQELTCLDFSDPSTRLHLLMSYAVQDRKETAV